jgi:hypothetical protein
MRLQDLRTGTEFNKQYLLGFVHREDAELVQRGTFSKSKMSFLDEEEHCVCEESFSVVVVERRVNINELPMFVHETSLQMFMELPFKAEANIGFVHQLLDVSHDEIVMEVQTLDAIDIRVL